MMLGYAIDEHAYASSAAMATSPPIGCGHCHAPFERRPSAVWRRFRSWFRSMVSSVSLESSLPHLVSVYQHTALQLLGNTKISIAASKCPSLCEAAKHNFPLLIENESPNPATQYHLLYFGAFSIVRAKGSFALPWVSSQSSAVLNPSKGQVASSLESCRRRRRRCRRQLLKPTVGRASDRHAHLIGHHAGGRVQGCCDSGADYQ